MLARRLDILNRLAETKYRRAISAIIAGVMSFYRPKITTLRQDAKLPKKPKWLDLSEAATRTIKIKVGAAFSTMWSTIQGNVSKWLDVILGKDRERAPVKDLRDLERVAKEAAIESVQAIHETAIEQINATENPPSPERIDAVIENAENKADNSAEIGVLASTSAINQTEQEASGQFFYWETMRDDRVRPLHLEVGERVWTWAALPKDPETGEEFAPGEQPRCRCTAVPSLDDQGSLDVEI